MSTGSQKCLKVTFEGWNYWRKGRVKLLKIDMGGLFSRLGDNGGKETQNLLLDEGDVKLFRQKVRRNIFSPTTEKMNVIKHINFYGPELLCKF